MKTLLLCLVLAMSVSAAINPQSKFPEVALTDGRTLKDFEIVSFSTSAVMAKWSGGRGTISYEALPAELRAEAEKMRPVKKVVALPAPRVATAFPVESKKPASPNGETKTQRFKGQAFIVTRGAGSYKFGGLPIRVFPQSAWGLFDTRLSIIDMPEPITTASTDADGNFEFSVPKDVPFVVFAQTRRLTGKYEEAYQWKIASTQIENPEAVHLSNGNHTNKLIGIRINGKLVEGSANFTPMGRK